jgi:hypothetical protein
VKIRFFYSEIFAYFLKLQKKQKRLKKNQKSVALNIFSGIIVVESGTKWHKVGGDNDV